VHEDEIAVAALKAALLGQANAGRRHDPPAFRGVVVEEAVAHAVGMGAPADALAVRVEDDELDLGEAVPDQEVGELQPQPLDGVRCRDLAEIAAGIGEAGLDAHPPAALEIGAVGRHLERPFEHLDAALERLDGLEQGRDVDLAVDAEALGEIERRQERERGLALGDEKADRLAAVEMLEHLRDQHEDAPRRGLLGRDRAEIDGLGLGLLDHLDDGVLVAQAEDRVVGGVVHVDRLADRVVQLDRVDPHMGEGRGQPVGGGLGLQDPDRPPGVGSLAAASARSSSAVSCRASVSRALPMRCISRDIKASASRLRAFSGRTPRAPRARPGAPCRPAPGAPRSARARRPCCRRRCPSGAGPR
jgi:hypothetical protein